MAFDQPVGTRLRLLVATVVAGCAPEPSLTAIVPGLPDDIVYYGALIEDDNHVVLSSTGLARRKPKEAVDLDLSATSDGRRFVRFIGFTEAQLASAQPPSDAELLAAPLIVASPTQGILPIPSLTALGVLNGGDATLSPTDEFVELTTSWLPSCPQLATRPNEVLVGIGCVTDFCLTSFEQFGCQLVIDADSCNNGATNGIVDGRGNVAFQDTETLTGCTLREPVEGALVSIECADGVNGACTLDAFEPPFVPRFTVDTMAVVDEPTKIRDQGVARPPIGYLGGVVALGDQIGVVSFSGSFRHIGCKADTPNSAMVFIDAERMVVTSSVPLPYCLNDIIADPQSDGFLATWGDEAPTLGRFDRAGRLITEVPIIDPLLGDAYYARGLAATNNGLRLGVALTRTASRTADSPAYVFLFDARSLQRTARTDGAVLRNAIGVTPGVGDELVVIDDEDSQIVVLDARSGILVELIAYRGLRAGERTKAGRILADGERIITTATGIGGAVHVLQRARTQLRSASAYEVHAEPYALDLWPPDARFRLVGFTTQQGARTAYLGLVDVTHGHLVPPMVEIGVGATGASTVDRAGRVWVTLPWSGRIARATSVP